MSARDEERQHLNGWLGRRLPRGGSKPAAVPAYQEALAQGKLAEAQRLCARALASQPADPWPYVCRAAARFQGGDLPGALADAAAFRRLKPRSAAGPAMEAIMAAQRGDQAAARRLLDEAARGRAGWAVGLRGMLKAKWGELEGARRDLERGGRTETSAWLLAERADVLNRAGLFWRALKDLDSMRALLPESPEPDRRAAAVHLDQAQYAEAAARLTRALTLAPDDAGLYEERSRVFFIEGDLPSARRDIETACLLAPGSDALLQRQIRLQVLSGDYAAAERSLSAGCVSAGLRLFWTAYIACRRGRYAAARAGFRRSLNKLAPHESDWARKASHYAVIAQILERAPAPAPAPANRELVIMGMGFRHPYQMSVQTIREMRGCETFYSNLSDQTVVDLLGLYPVPMKTIVFRRSDGQSTACARIVMRGMRGHGRAGMVTRGHPLFYGRLAKRLVDDCARRRYSCRVVPSVSISELFPSLADGHVRGQALGAQVRDSSRLGGLDFRLALLVYNFTSGEGRRELCRRLAALYPASHPCWLLAGSGHAEYEPRAHRMAELPEALMGADAAVTLLIAARQAS